MSEPDLVAAGTRQILLVDAGRRTRAAAQHWPEPTDEHRQRWQADLERAGVRRLELV